MALAKVKPIQRNSAAAIQPVARRQGGIFPAASPRPKA